MGNMQYTIRGISEQLDARNRERAARHGRSLNKNKTVLEVLRAGLGIDGDRIRHSDLNDLAGTWIDDPQFDRAIAEIDRVDPELWK